MGSSNIGISVVVAVSIERVVGSIAVRGVAVKGVGSIGRGTAIGVGGGGDHGMSGSSAHVHLLPMIYAPLAVTRSIRGVPMTISVGGVSIAISIRGVSVAISVGRVAVTATIPSVTVATIAPITITAIAIST